MSEKLVFMLQILPMMPMLLFVLTENQPTVNPKVLEELYHVINAGSPPLKGNNGG